MTVRTCLQCGGRGKVLNSNATKLGHRRRLQCANCGQRWSTLEVIAEAKRGANRAPKAKRRTMGEKMMSRRDGILVPPDLEAEWTALKRKALSNTEVARLLNLPVPKRKRAK